MREVKTYPELGNGSQYGKTWIFEGRNSKRFANHLPGRWIKAHSPYIKKHRAVIRDKVDGLPVRRPSRFVRPSPLVRNGDRGVPRGGNDVQHGNSRIVCLLRHITDPSAVRRKASAPEVMNFIRCYNTQ